MADVVSREERFFLVLPCEGHPAAAFPAEGLLPAPVRLPFRSLLEVELSLFVDRSLKGEWQAFRCAFRGVSPDSSAGMTDSHGVLGVSRTCVTARASLGNASGLLCLQSFFRENRRVPEEHEQASGEVTGLLKRWTQGDASAIEALWPLLHDDLRRLARRQLANERADHTLQRTALVNEAFIRLSGQRSIDWLNREQFLSLAAKIMRRVLKAKELGQDVGDISTIED